MFTLSLPGKKNIGLVEVAFLNPLECSSQPWRGCPGTLEGAAAHLLEVSWAVERASQKTKTKERQTQQFSRSEVL